MSGHYFICHASEDRLLAGKLVNDLESCGIPCWICIRNIPGTENWPKYINVAIRECKALILILSKNSVDNENVHGELALARKYRRPILAFSVGVGFDASSIDYYFAHRQIEPIDHAVERLSSGAVNIEGSSADGAKIKVHAHGLMRNRGMSRIVALGAIGAVVAIFAIWVFRPQPAQVAMPVAPVQIIPAPLPPPVIVQPAAAPPAPAPVPARAPESAPRQEPVKRAEPGFATVPPDSGGALRPRTSLEGYAPPPEAKDTHGIVPEDSSGPLRPRIRLE